LFVIGRDRDAIGEMRVRRGSTEEVSIAVLVEGYLRARPFLKSFECKIVNGRLCSTSTIDGSDNGAWQLIAAWR
jgi:hypothetical protein